MATQFKVGDKVRTLPTNMLNYDQYPVGTVGTVVRVEDSLVTTVHPGDSTVWNYFPDELELVDPPASVPDQEAMDFTERKVTDDSGDVATVSLRGFSDPFVEVDVESSLLWLDVDAALDLAEALTLAAVKLRSLQVQTAEQEPPLAERFPVGSKVRILSDMYLTQPRDAIGTVVGHDESMFAGGAIQVESNPLYDGIRTRLHHRAHLLELVDDSPLKIGDRVRITGLSFAGFDNIGRIGVVEDFEEDGLFVGYDNGSGNYFPFSSVERA